MSQIDDLIQELCPRGLVKVLLGDVAEFQRGTSITKDQTTPGHVPVIGGGQKPAYFHGNSNRTGLTIVVAGSGAYAGFVSLWRGPIWVSDAFTIKPKSDTLSTKFLFYFLQSIQDRLHDLKKGGGVPHVYGKDVAKFQIQVPPLEVQQEIVRILDTFTELEAELEAGLEARKKQYEYYRNSLIHEIVESSKIFTLGEVCQVFDGTHQTPNYVHQGIKFVSVENIKDLNGSNKYITEEDFHKLYKNKPSRGDLLMTRIGSVGDCAVIDVDEPLAYYVSLALLKPNQMKLASGYLKFYLESSAGKRELYKRTLHQAVPIKINLGDISKLQIAVPSLEMQVSLIRKLEAFQATTESATNGLPAEIVARRKQYEYYRNKLLTFKELAV